jgi:hypothetical protein
MIAVVTVAEIAVVTVVDAGMTVVVAVIAVETVVAQDVARVADAVNQLAANH